MSSGGRADLMKGNSRESPVTCGHFCGHLRQRVGDADRWRFWCQYGRFAASRDRGDGAGPADARDHASAARACAGAGVVPAFRRLNGRADDARRGHAGDRAR